MKTHFALLAFALNAGCMSPELESETVDRNMAAPETATQAEAEAAAEPLMLTASGDAYPEELLPRGRAWTGDFDGMIERRVIRAVVTVSLTGYFLDGATQRGITYDALQAFEKALNEKLNTGNLKVHVAIIPVARDQLIPALLDGRADIAAANLTITPERQKLVDFSEAGWTGVSELVVTGPSAPPLSELDDLSGQEIHVRASSSYYESLQSLNEELRAAGKEPARLVLADEHMEDEDLLQMVDAGLIPIVIIDSTKLADEVNAFIRANRKGTLLGNMLFKRYLKNTKWVEHALSSSEMAKFRATIDLFQKYGDEYDFDYLMLAALGYQESRLDQSARSNAGAVGVMQLLPTTAADPNVGIPDVEILENNIHAGTKYLRFVKDRYFAEEDMDEVEQTLFTFASYNAGPARVRGLRRKAEASGLDPNVWFDNVEVIAAHEIGRETVQYVSNIYKYYIA